MTQTINTEFFLAGNESTAVSNEEKAIILYKVNRFSTSYFFVALIWTLHFLTLPFRFLTAWFTNIRSKGVVITGRKFEVCTVVLKLDFLCKYLHSRRNYLCLWLHFLILRKLSFDLEVVHHFFFFGKWDIRI